MCTAASDLNFMDKLDPARWQGKRVLMMAGGTGGHVFPALAVAGAARDLGAEVHWLGNAKGFEGQKVPAAGFVLHDIAVRGLRGKGLLLVAGAVYARSRVLAGECGVASPAS